MFDNFPKKRNALPEKYKAIYSTYYKKNREGHTAAASISQRLEAWLHKKVAEDVKLISNRSTLEIGAGTLNQLKHEDTQPYDIIEPFRSLFADSPFLNKIRNIYNDIDEIDLQNIYDRITAVATFEHVVDLPKVVAKSCLLLNPSGSLRVAIPNEGTYLWTFCWRMSTGLEFELKHRMSFKVLMEHEHVNTAKEIEDILKYFYEEQKCSLFGIHKQFALYRFYECTRPKIDAAREYLKTLSGKS